MKHRTGIAAVTLTVALGLPVPLAHAAAAPSMIISIDDGRPRSDSGDELVYRIKVTNTGPAELRDLRVAQTLPPGLRLISADHNGRNTSQNVEWTVTVPARTSTTMTGRAALTSVPAGTSRLASSACAYLTGQDRPLVCSTDTNELGANVSAAADRTADPTTWWYWAGGAPVALIAAAVAVRLRRRGEYRT